MDEWYLGSLLAATLRVATPLILCALAGLYSERSGVVDIGLEGKMLFAAFAAGSVGALTGSTLAAVAAAMGIAVLLGWLHGLACVSHNGDQVVSGIAINMVAVGLTAVLGIAWFGRGGQTPSVAESVRIGPLFDATAAGQGGVSQTLLGQTLLGHNALVYVALLLVALTWWLMYRTRLGLRLRAVGENPRMVDVAGLSVVRLRYTALTLNGMLCGLAGSYLVLAQGTLFTPGMTAGRGFMALAALIFGRWHPVGALGACLLFGLLDAVAIRLQGVVIGGVGEIPVQAIQALPYGLTVVLLAGYVGRSAVPQALGKPFVKHT